MFKNYSPEEEGLFVLCGVGSWYFTGRLIFAVQTIEVLIEAVEGGGGAVIGRAIYQLCNVVKRVEHARGTPLVLYYVQEYAGYKSPFGIRRNYCTAGVTKSSG